MRGLATRITRAGQLVTLGQSFVPVLDAAKAGSEWAWATLYGEIAGPVIGFFRCRGLTDPENAAGDVFFELARGLQAFDSDEDAFKTLVFAIAFKRLLEESGGRLRGNRTALAGQVLERLRGDQETMSVLRPEEDFDDVREALLALTPAERDVVSLRVVGELSNEQVSEIIGAGVNRVRDLQRKGLQRIRGSVSRHLVAS